MQQIEHIFHFLLHSVKKNNLLLKEAAGTRTHFISIGVTPSQQCWRELIADSWLLKLRFLHVCAASAPFDWNGDLGVWLGVSNGGGCMCSSWGRVTPMLPLIVRIQAGGSSHYYCCRHKGSRYLKYCRNNSLKMWIKYYKVIAFADLL